MVKAQNKDAELKKIQRQAEAERKKREKEKKKTESGTNFNSGQVALDFDNTEKEYIKRTRINLKVSNVIGWVGGKAKVAKELTTMMPTHNHYVEVFFGGGGVFFGKPKSNRNSINDYNGNLINMYLQIRDNHEKFLTYLNHFIYSRDLFNISLEKYKDDDWKNLPDFQRAVIFYFILRTSFNSQMNHFTAEQDYSIYDEFYKIISIKEKLQGVLIENLDFRVFIEKRLKSGGKDVLFYLDPPYVVAEGKGYYEYLFSNNEHSDLARLCDQIDKSGHKFMLSYENTSIIRDLYRNYELNVLEWAYSMGAGTDGKQKKGEELIVTNFKPNQQQLDVFNEYSERATV